MGRFVTSALRCFGSAEIGHSGKAARIRAVGETFVEEFGLYSQIFKILADCRADKPAHRLDYRPCSTPGVYDLGRDDVQQYRFVDQVVLGIRSNLLPKIEHKQFRVRSSIEQSGTLKQLLKIFVVDFSRQFFEKMRIRRLERRLIPLIENFEQRA